MVSLLRKQQLGRAIGHTGNGNGFEVALSQLFRPCRGNVGGAFNLTFARRLFGLLGFGEEDRRQQATTHHDREPNQRKVLAGLGLRGPHRSVVVDNTPSFRGMVKKVLHLVTVEESDG